MSPWLAFGILAIYFSILLVIAWITSRKNDSNESFFVANRTAPWYLVAIGMLGASISGVTFISVPGWVGTAQFSYLQMVLGYFVGYLVIGTVLMPLYYRLNLTSIYTYLEHRFGTEAYKTGAVLFLVSRLIGSSFRLFLVSGVLQLVLFEPLGIPFSLTVVFTIFLIWVYTFRGGQKTILYTDSFQSIFLVASLISAIVLIAMKMDLSFGGLIQTVSESDYSKVFFFDDWRDKKFFFKQFISGAFIAIAMTGLDQDLMQKNLACRNLKDAQKNMFWFTLSLLPINLLFLSLGALLYLFALQQNIPLPEKSDMLFPMIATGNYLPQAIGIFFLLGVTASSFASADSALTALTTSVSLDLVSLKKYPEASHVMIRKLVHVLVSLVRALIILIFWDLNNDSVISAVFTAAGYTYGPLLGLFSFGLFTRKMPRGIWVPVICIISPILCYIISMNSSAWFGGYQFSFELLLLNGMLTFVGLWLSSFGKTEAVIPGK